MNCKNWEVQLYLYDELSDAERRETDQHLQTCMECQLKFNAIGIAREKIRASGAMKVGPPNPEALTKSIMEAVVASTEKKSFTGTPVSERFGNMINILFNKYALAVVSCLLMAFFITEQIAVQTSNHTSRVSTLNEKMSKLDTPALLKRLAAQDQHPKKQLSLYAYSENIRRQNKNTGLR